MKHRKLPQDFYLRDTKRVAQNLLGKRLVRVVGGKRLAGLIVETEAYLGAKDKAAHTAGGRRTERNEVMYGAGGHAYVYFIYGMHFCLNAVTKPRGVAEAVLIRALEPVEGIDQMRTNRQKAGARQLRDFELANGPGKLCQALGVTRNLNGLNLTGKRLFIEDSAIKVRASQIVAGPRIGVQYAEEAATWPLRFCIMGNPYVSKPWPPKFKGRAGEK